MRRLRDVFLTSLRLGLTSFGGPIAHLGYFERVYVREKRWLSHEDFSHTVALCQLLPGPTSSQVNFLIGLQRAGWAGAVLSWLGFTLPSALLMYLFAMFALSLEGHAMTNALHGLKVAAVVIVAQALWFMAPRLCPDKTRTGIALAAMSILLFFGSALAQAVAIVAGALAGWFYCVGAQENPGSQQTLVSRRVAWVAGGMFLALLVLLPVISAIAPGGIAALIDISYRSGALVFGGGHVVLPLLRDAMVPAGMMDDHTFLAGYGAAQALPGPLFALSSYLGAVAAPAGQAWVWALCALFFIFLPGMLVALAGVPLWRWMSRHPSAKGALAGVNAAVVGILAAAFYDPVWQTAVLDKTDVVIAVAAYFMLERWKVQPILAVIFCVAGAFAF